MSGKINLVLAAMLVACGLSLVNAQYQARHLFIELERAQSQARQLDIEWAQLQLDQSQQAMAKGVLELACELARQVLRRELSTNPNALQPVVREALAMLTVDSKLAAVRMNPVDLDRFSEDLAREFSNLKLTLVPDASVTVGGCLVEAAGTVVDGTVQRRWNKAVASLGLESTWEQDDDVR